MNAIAAVSDIEQINAALQSHNPFAQPPFVNANNVWGKGFPDVETLNAHASDAIFKALDEIRAGHYSTTSILITAQDGTGKTHIISRIRHRLQAQGGALFVFANKFNDLNQIKQGFQQLLAESLSNIGSQGVKQWQELAASMANDTAKSLGLPTMAPKDFVKKFDASETEQNVKWINQLTKAFCRAKTVQDPDIVRAIFWTLSDEEALYASNWLAGKELAQFKANDLRLPTQKQSFDAVLQILSLISEYNELVVCFDELDVLEINDAGLHKSQVVANLVKELVENLQRGVILSVMMPGTWKERIQDVLPKGLSSKMKTAGEALPLKYLDSDSTVDLIAFSLKEYYDAREITPPHPVYPFNEEQLRTIGKEKPTVREVLKWCRENCKPPLEEGPVVPIEPDNPVEMAFITEISDDITNGLDNNQVVAEALLTGFQSLVGKTVENVKVQNVTTGVGKKGRRDPYLNFKILGEENGKEVAIGVAVLQYEGGAALGAGFRRLMDEDKQFDLTRGCLVRSKAKPIKYHFKKKYLDPLVKNGGEFVELKEEEIKPLLAIRSIYQKRESDYGVTEDDISRFIEEKGAANGLGIHNKLLLEILSDPSYQVPQDIEDEPEAPAEPESKPADDSDEAEATDLAELLTTDGAAA
ncbi:MULTISPECIES: AAA family ATPase [unclassified Leptolyngbya]|uniref:AAA family ATPase n=1 Tax=unclassified Leptolyngbya TaxID=2650499 RepID=UPI001682554E|nr:MULTISPECIES: AAA family ATPase [unclassified Leptolyngbya]MBD1912399.1 ATP-binding protein [Leptolyngbya sp. FACHB-8]MBD2154803.1 ATP-binding protein [Leptolyngbya sp. FACHB-16]